MGKYILGYDLNDSMSQISYFELNTSVPETVASDAEEERLGIPTVLSKRKGVAQWDFGNAAIRAAETGSATLVDQLMGFAMAGAKIDIEGEAYDATDLLILFVRRSLNLLSMVLSLPLFAFGYINNFVPTQITKFFTNKMKDPMLHSSVQYVVGTIATFPVWYLLLLALVWIISKHFWIAIAYVALTGLSAFFVHYYKLACQKLLTVVRATRLRHTAAYNTMSSLHKVITGTMERIIY